MFIAVGLIGRMKETDLIWEGKGSALCRLRNIIIIVIVLMSILFVDSATMCYLPLLL